MAITALLRVYVNGDATESFRVNLWSEMSLFLLTMKEDVSDIYTSAADTHLLVLLPVLLLQPAVLPVLLCCSLLFCLFCSAACSPACWWRYRLINDGGGVDLPGLEISR